MKKFMIVITFLFVFLMSIPSEAANEKYWLRGKVKGYNPYEVVTIELINISTGYVEVDTSANKFGVFAFSDNDRGSPSQYKLRIYAGDRFVKEVFLRNVRPGGWVPDVSIR